MRTRFSGILAVGETEIRYVDAHSDIQWKIRWGDITKIAMWKHDCVVVDLLCMGFLVEGAPCHQGCDENAEGWDDLQSQLLRRYNLKIEDWWDKVVLPAFVENFTVVWER